MTLIPMETDGEGRELTPAAGGLASTDLQRIRQALDHSVSDNTRAAYQSAWRSFEAWAQARAALTLPASPALAAAYLSHPAQERRLAVATVRLHKAALAAMHRASGHPDPTDNEGVRRVLQGISRAHGRPQKQARPLTAEALRGAGHRQEPAPPGGREAAGVGPAGLLAGQGGRRPPLGAPAGAGMTRLRGWERAAAAGFPPIPLSGLCAFQAA